MYKRTLLFIGVVLLLSSCSSTQKQLSNKPYDFYDGINKITKDISEQLLEKQTKIKIAIMPILNENGDRTLFGENISNLLQVGIFEKNKQITMVERERIDSVYDEISFGLNGNINETDIYEIGSLLSVNAVLVGTLRNEKDYFSFYVRLVDVEKGNVLALSQVIISKDENINSQFNTIVKYSANNYSGGYELHLLGSTISEVDENGISWDAFSRADVMFHVEVNGIKKYESMIYSDFPKIKLQENIDLVLENNSIISIIVYDADVSSNQKIGQINLTSDDIRYLLRNKEIV